MYASEIRDSKGNSVFSEDDYAVTCTKYFVYGMVNLWAFSGNNCKKARKQLKKYMNDELYSIQLRRAQNVDISKYGFSNRLRVSIDAARNMKINVLLCYAKLSDFRATVKQKNPIYGNKIFP